MYKFALFSPRRRKAGFYLCLRGVGGPSYAGGTGAAGRFIFEKFFVSR